MEDYEKLEKVGEGTYGKVYKAKCKKTGTIVALKKTLLGMEEEGVPSTTLREVSLLRMLSKSVHVVRLLNVEHITENNKPMLYLVFEYLDTDLKKYMGAMGKGPSHPLDPKIVKNFMYQLLMGVAHCHSHGVMHRDLKPQNLLVDKDRGLVKIADLGLGRAFTVPIKSYTHEIVTLWYRAPEVLLGATHYSTAVDMWSVAAYLANSLFAMVSAEMAHKVPLFLGDSELEQLLIIFKILGTPNDMVWPGVSNHCDWHEFPQWRAQNLALFVPELDEKGVDLLKHCLEYDPAKRITAKDALQHPYFDNFDKSQFDAPF